MAHMANPRIKKRSYFVCDRDESIFKLVVDGHHAAFGKRSDELRFLNVLHDLLRTMTELQDFGPDTVDCRMLLALKAPVVPRSR